MDTQLSPEMLEELKELLRDLDLGPGPLDDELDLEDQDVNDDGDMTDIRPEYTSSASIFSENVTLDVTSGGKSAMPSKRSSHAGATNTATAQTDDVVPDSPHEQGTPASTAAGASERSERFEDDLTPRGSSIGDVAPDVTSCDAKGPMGSFEAVLQKCTDAVEPLCLAATESFEAHFKRREVSTDHYLVLGYRVGIAAKEDPAGLERVFEEFGLRLTKHARGPFNAPLQALHHAAGIPGQRDVFASRHGKRLERVHEIVEQLSDADPTDPFEDPVVHAVKKLIDDERTKKKLDRDKKAKSGTVRTKTEADVIVADRENVNRDREKHSGRETAESQDASAIDTPKDAIAAEPDSQARISIGELPLTVPPASRTDGTEAQQDCCEVDTLLADLVAIVTKMLDASTGLVGMEARLPAEERGSRIEHAKEAVTAAQAVRRDLERLRGTLPMA